jgi:oligopeptide/dipeptide ABC transporter ATP-binding protein
MSENIIECRNVKKDFIDGGIFRKKSIVHAVDNVSFDLKAKETLGIVGESGCGKTTLLLVLQRLLEPTSGTVKILGKKIFELKKNELQTLRREMATIFQDPYSSINPKMTIADVITEPLKIQKLMKGEKKEDVVEKALEEVRLSPYYMHRYPHQLSGGEKQRVAISRALIGKPKLIFADEPVSSLDVSVRANLLNMLMDLTKKRGLTSLYISHDLRTVKYLSNRIAVMYLGKIVELAPSLELYNNTLHPYTQALISAIPRIDPTLKQERIILRGGVPSPTNPPSGCTFHPRCIHRMTKCSNEEPAFVEVKKDHFVACHLHT